MKVLVTGGAGYVGSACLRYLLTQGWDAVAFDNLCQGHRGAVPADRLIEGDINDTEAVRAAIRSVGAEGVLHFAAATDVAESVRNPEYHYANNIAGTLSLLVAMREEGVKRLLFSSTSATYGLAPEVPMRETTGQNPVCAYARTKLAVEWMIRDFATAYGLGFTLLRYFNAAGADPDGANGEDHVPENHLIPIVLEVPRGQREEVLVYGGDYDTPDGTCIRDYVHTRDLASAHFLAMSRTTETTDAVFNIGTGRGHTVLEVLRACEEIVGEKIPHRIVDRRPGDPPALVADPTKLKTELGWEPEYPELRSIVETAWQWHQAHPNGYRQVVAQ